jgi:hypothetical protein
MEDKDITWELFLDSNSRDSLTSHDNDHDQDDIQWTDNTQSQHSAPVIHRFTQVPVGYIRMKLPL